MKSREEELKAIFLAEAMEQREQLNKLFTLLEKNTQNRSALEAIFRITHTLKANAAALGFAGISEISHALEDVFSLAKTHTSLLNDEVFNDLFRASDKLGELIMAVKTEQAIPYKGLLTKLRVIERKFSEEIAPTHSTQQATANQNQAVNPETAAEPTIEPLPDADEKTVPQAIAFSDFIQVPVKKLEQLMNLVGELTIERDRLLTASAKKSGRTSNEFAALYRITADIQYAVMSVRLVKVDVLFDKFHRIVRDVANLEGKNADLILEGTDIEIDRNVLQAISESLIHLVRNAISHGIETEEERIKAGKPGRGTITLSAKNDKDAIVIDIIDDGKGIDTAIIRKKAVEKGIISPEQAFKLSEREVLDLIFVSGFSSKDQVTQVSGRGVGMDAVKKSLESMGGEIQMRTELGEGSIFSLILPASMAIKKALLFEVGHGSFSVPLTFIESVVQLKKEDIHKVGKGLMASYGERTLSLIFLFDLFDLDSFGEEPSAPTLQRGYERLLPKQTIYVILLQIEDRWIGLVVDKLIQQKEVIEKPLTHALNGAKYISGASIMGDGGVCLMLDVPAIARHLFKNPVNASI